MPGPQTLNDANTSLDVLHAHYRFLLARVKSDPNGTPFLKDLKAFGAQWTATDKTEMDLEDAVTDADAGAVAADGGIDRLSDDVSVAIHGARKPDANAPLHQLYFGGLTLSRFKQPVLGVQLTRIAGWPTLLGQSSEPGLKALVKQATTAIDAGDGAAKAVEAAQKALDNFRLGGERKKIFDTFNSLCARIYGALKSFVHDHPNLRLPITYPDSFFQHGASARPASTVAEAAAAVASLEKKLAHAQKIHTALVARHAVHEAAAAALQKAKADAVTAKKLTQDAHRAQKAAEAAAKKKIKR